ncbi:MAG: hypothetical protein JWP08_562 [Bryobacterales bacterium]|nr:hypothetical protein [Bryobacterales bacterium]
MFELVYSLLCHLSRHLNTDTYFSHFVSQIVQQVGIGGPFRDLLSFSPAFIFVATS